MALSENQAWNSVALEERIELISKSQADGVLASLVFLTLSGSIGYGFNQIWLLAAGALGAFLIIPLFTSRSWRKQKPAIIMSYLAARSVARRYAYGYGIRNLDIILIFRGFLEESYQSAEDKAFAQKDEYIDFESSIEGRKEVWICLLRGGVIAISEKLGGAKLEFATAIDKDSACDSAEPTGQGDMASVTISGSGKSKGRVVVLTSNYPGALYVFRKQCSRLIDEAKQLSQHITELATNQKKLTNY